MTLSRPDSIDRAAGLAVDAACMALRDPRPEFIRGAEACRRSVLEPADDLGLEPGLRLAVARRVILGTDQPELLAEYPLPQAPAFHALANGEMPEDQRQAAIAHHADMIARTPSRAGAQDLQALLAAGLSVPQVIALSELIAFACFQAQVVAGLSLLGGRQ